MSNHTPGPWVFESRNGDHPLNDQDGWGCDGLWAVNGGFILGAGPGWDRSYVAPDDSDARLIATAPDLLEALMECVEDSEAAVGQYVQAYGETYRPKRLAAMRETVRKARAAIAKATGELP